MGIRIFTVVAVGFAECQEANRQPHGTGWLGFSRGNFIPYHFRVCSYDSFVFGYCLGSRDNFRDAMKEQPQEKKVENVERAIDWLLPIMAGSGGF